MMMPELKNPGFFNHICFAFILHDFQVAVNSFDFFFSSIYYFTYFKKIQIIIFIHFLSIMLYNKIVIVPI